MTKTYKNNLKEYVDKAKTLMEALPYINEFSGKVVVIKYGGSAMNDSTVQETIIQDIALMKFVGMNPVIVHGGGPEINLFLSKLGKETDFVNGLRVTDAETMEIVEMALCGKLAKQIAANLMQHGVRAASVSGKDGGMLLVEKLCPDGIDIGFVGEIKRVDGTLIKTLMDSDFIPIISPVGADVFGNSYNINADYAAVSIAGALKAEKLVFLTDVEGVLENINDSSSRYARLSVSEIPKLIEQGIISGGMIPKVECCVKGVESGVKHVHMLDGRIEHSLILEIFTNEGIGTLIEN